MGPETPLAVPLWGWTHTQTNTMELVPPPSKTMQWDWCVPQLLQEARNPLFSTNK